MDKKEMKIDFITADFVNVFTSKKILNENHQFSRKEKEIFSLENNFYEKIVGQDLAINSLAGVIRRMREKKMVENFYSLLFIGSVGLGKKEMTKVFSEQYFGKKMVIEIEVSDFLENTREKLLGSQNKKSFFSTLKNVQNSVILFKNLEKANIDFLAILSFILKHKFIKDNFQETISFQNSVLIATFKHGIFVYEKFNGKEFRFE